MSEKSYLEKLRSPLWQRKRLEIFQRDNWTCVSCGRQDDNAQLHVHHMRYVEGLEPWEHPNYIMVTYCEYCHNAEHLIGETLREFFLERIQANDLYLKPIAQLGTLIDRWPAFSGMLKAFLNDSISKYLQTQEKAK